MQRQRSGAKDTAKTRVRITCAIFGNAIAGAYGLFVFIWHVFVSIVDVS